jgi:hypothetical protein
VAAGPKQAAAGGALVKVTLGMKNVLRHQAHDLFPSYGAKPGIAAAAAAQGRHGLGVKVEAPNNLGKLAGKAVSREHQQVRPPGREGPGLPGEDVHPGLLRRQTARPTGRQAHHLGVEAAKPQPFGQPGQGLIHQEFHNVLLNDGHAAVKQY